MTTPNLMLPSLLEAQPADVRSVALADRDKLIISLTQVDGEWVILSRYGDDSWVMPPNKLNVRKAAYTLQFDRLPPSLKAVWKEIFFRYMRRGREGGKRPAPGTMVGHFERALDFAKHLDRLGIRRLQDVNEFVCDSYVEYWKSYRQTWKKTAPKLTQDSLVLVFLAVEAVFELSQYTSDPMPEHPWPNSSATHLAAKTGANKRRGGGKTLLIPNEVFSRMFKTAWACIECAPRLLDLRDEIQKIAERQPQIGVSWILKQQNRYLAENGFPEGCEELGRRLVHVRTACYIVVASLSGCRNHEITFLRNGACYSSKDDQGNVFWWMRSTSTKTGEGDTEWMIPPAAVQAIEVLERCARPLQLLVQKEIATRRTANPKDPEIAEALQHCDALFLGKNRKHRNEVRVLTIQALKKQLEFFCRDFAIEWKIQSHQFRKTFATYAARSQFGDLRYLKEHFKHWSMDMTLLYGLNDGQEVGLYLEVLQELDEVKEGVAALWLAPEEPLAGGYGKNLMHWRRTEGVTMFKDHQTMVRAIAASTAIRSTGHSWCTADDDLCIGNDLEKTRCGSCSNAAIGRPHRPFYRGLASHLTELLTCADIGPGGKARVQRDLDRCLSVLTDLELQEAK